MNSKQAKRIKKSVYGSELIYGLELSPRMRKYKIMRKYKRMKKEGGKGTFIIADDNRRMYRKAKKMYTRGEL